MYVRTTYKTSLFYNEQSFDYFSVLTLSKYFYTDKFQISKYRPTLLTLNSNTEVNEYKAPYK